MKILLKNAKILTLKNKDIVNGDLLVEGNKIVRIALKINVKANKVIDCEGNLLMPGFKDAHAHNGMTFLRSASDDLNLQDWLNEIVFPAEAHFKKDDIYHLTKLAYLELISSGVTANFDMYFHLDEIRKASLEIGMRSTLLVMPDGSDKSIKHARELLLKNKEKESLVTYLLGYHSEYTTTKSQLERISKLAHEFKIPTYTHCSETVSETEGSIKRHKLTPTQYLDSLGLFDYGGGIFHGVYVNKKDIALLKKKHVYVCTCPCSNLKLASGIAPIKELFSNGVKVAIGTDGPASNNALDMFREIYLVSTLAKVREKDPACIDAFNVLKMACVNGANMIGVKNATYLEEGKLADLIMIDLHRPDMQPINNIINNLVYSGNKLDVKMTMINGKILYYNHNFYLKESVDQIYKNAQKITNRLLNYKK